MKIGVPHLTFILPDQPFGKFPLALDELTEQAKSFEKKAGAGNEKFIIALNSVVEAVHNKQDIATVLDAPIKVRALAIALQSDVKDKINLTESVFNKINQLRPNPSSLLIQSIYQYYLTAYDYLVNPPLVAEWLKDALGKKGLLKGYHENLLCDNGPKWLADQCVVNNRDFNNELAHLNLENYSSGRFLTIAKSIYFVEKLKTIPVNQPHPLLVELQNGAVFDSRYDEHHLLGHEVLRILIERAPQTGIDDSWLNIIMAIAGDPRVPYTHPNYQKWWSALDSSLNTKVRGWLSRLDLRLFLEALKDYSFQRGNQELKKMFPARKKFLEGLLDKKLITDTRLYLSLGAEAYLRKNYKSEHLPSYSLVMDGDKSLIHVQLGDSHMIEGSHNCYLWIYRKLDSSAIVFDYARKRVTYSSLTQGLSQKMRLKGTPHQANITHSPVNFSWQHKAIDVLNDIGINITPKDVLSEGDYLLYKRRHGIR